MNDAGAHMFFYTSFCTDEKGCFLLFTAIIVHNTTLTYNTDDNHEIYYIMNNNVKKL